METSRIRIGYIPALDGLRAAAVLAVLLYHGDVTWMQGGYLGVDAFFVLSGFLITALLLREWRSSHGIAFLRFWGRRARRLLPALGLVILAVVVYGAMIASPEELASLRSDVFATLGYAMNWRLLASDQGYFDQFAAPSPLRHVWSLAIEEQFYLVWPLVVYGLCRWLRLSWRAMAALFGGLAVVSSVVMVALYSSDGVNRVYYGTDTRAQALLVGAALATVFVSVPPASSSATTRVLSCASWAGAAFTAWLWIGTDDRSTWLFQGGYLLAAVAVAAVIARVAQPKSGALGAVLSWPPLRWIGLISYGLYLWHWPIYVVVTTDRVGLDGARLLMLRLALTFAAATASFYLVEMPVRRGALHGWRRWVVVPTALGALVAATLVVTSDARSGVAAGGSEAAVARDARAENADAERARASAGESAAPPTIALVVGDSVALTLGLGLQEVGEPHKVLTWNLGELACGIVHGGEVVIDGVPQTIDESCDQVPSWAQAVRDYDPDIVLVLGGAWDAYDRRFDGELVEFGSPASDAFIEADLQAGVDALRSTGAKVVFATVPYYENRAVVNRPEAFRSAFDHERVDHFNALLRRVAAANAPDVGIVDLHAYLEPAGRRSLLEDGVHFGVDSRKVVGEWLAPKLRELAIS